ncbi:MAG: nicotinate (nicotinamide) nucleotide adenylyltransferase [Nitrospirae bacterium GWC2_57_13]|nr:MAG: nicotinate (nicotinamide) nucleotide adenylyltransferase [Nitrospirae bacterium GWC2_57_13]
MSVGNNGSRGGSVRQRIGILGGTFNPIHYGHLAAAEEVGGRLRLDRVLFIPSYLPPHKAEEKIPSAAHRTAMVLLAIAGNPRFSLSEIEINRGGRSYTVDTIEELRSLYPGAKLFFLTGVDSFLEIRTWHQWERLLGLCAFVVLSRPGYRFSDLLIIDFMQKAAKDIIALDNGEVDQVEIEAGKAHFYLEMISHYEISSTDIRNRVREGLSIKYLLPEPVEHYIITNELYA